MSAHTPGGWDRNVKPARKYPIIYAGRNTHVAQVLSQGLADEEVEANCNLIAAAPDLLAALQQCYAHLGWSPNKIPSRVETDARAAIARATGEAK